jgi:hypothetical protein
MVRINMLVLERSYIRRPLILLLFAQLPSVPQHLAATKLAMSSSQRQPNYRNDSASSDPVKNISAIERGAETPEALADQDYYTRYPNNWAKIRSARRCRSQSPVAYGPHREMIREPAAEMLGTMILTLFGTAGNCQVVLSANSGVASSPKGDYLSLAIGWACGQSILYSSYRTPDQERRYRCWSGCLGLWWCLRRPRKPCGRLPFLAPSLYFSLEHTCRSLYALPSLGTSHGARFPDIYLGSSLALGLVQSSSLVTTSMP